ncbi:hypothetical protein D9758_009853 [Tetrapyrgos nigripes]|uniref:GST N-terminal domain-containing protein n=1 Tax=Tetrapyrgos nigripes TaxID=182062 RepID=A0A8H5LRU0_9AGAR|nr:hypothetical protein D9758_009853 [Tetrapyrgos nigripes]
MITLYDLNTLRPDPYRTYSPHAWKVHCVLRFKSLPYQTFWLEYPSIESKAKELGAPPTSTWSDGSRYTIPFIHDSTTNKVISDSLLIVEYLDNAYPDTITLITPGTEALQSVFADAIWTVYMKDIDPVIGRTLPNKFFTEANAEYYRKWAPKDPNEEMTEESIKDSWKRFESRFGELAETIGDEPFVMGNQVSFSDCALIGWLMLLRFALWDDDKGKQRWNEIMEWHGGRWKRLIDTYEELRDTRI